MVFGPTKNHQLRVVVLPRLLVDPLTAHIEGKDPDDFVFSPPGGGVMRNSNFRHRVLTPAVRLRPADSYLQQRSGVDGSAGLPRVPREPGPTTSAGSRLDRPGR